MARAPFGREYELSSVPAKIQEPGPPRNWIASAILWGAVTPVVELRAARKRFGQVEALKGVDLAIGPGELVALLGPNGAGKTTSISLMLGLRHPTGGEARLFGLDPTDRRARSRCGVMLQESGTTGVLTVREIVNLFRAYYPASLPADRAIALAGLDARANARIGTLSGGERQRLYFALAVCGDPDALFLDEPTVGMDVEGRRAVLQSIRALSTAGKTIVLTTHYLEGGRSAGEPHRRDRSGCRHRRRDAPRDQGPDSEQADHLQRGGIRG
jgi:ABC-type multidrug transport system ATPase subunit